MLTKGRALLAFAQGSAAVVTRIPKESRGALQGSLHF